VRAPARWPLATVLRLAARREAEARAALAEALCGHDRAAAERDASAEALGAHRAAGAAGGGGPGPGIVAGALAGRALHAACRAAEEARLAAVLRRHDAALAAAAAGAEGARAALAAARAAASTLEAGRDAWRAARARDRLRAEDDAVDEGISARRGAGG
jgi:hypothetical protein